VERCVKDGRGRDRRWAVGKVGRCVKDGRGKDGRWEGEKMSERWKGGSNGIRNSEWGRRKIKAKSRVKR
jgi:hypothetical protein